MRRAFPALLLAATGLLLAACAGTPPIDAATMAQLAPTGTLRVGINHGNAVLVQRDAATGALTGLAPDLAHELARRAGLPIAIVPFESAGRMAAAAALPGMRVLPGRFMAIGQASGVPQGRPLAQRYLADFIEDAKASGFVAASMQRHGIRGASVAPPAAP